MGTSIPLGLGKIYFFVVFNHLQKQFYKLLYGASIDIFVADMMIYDNEHQ